MSNPRPRSAPRARAALALLIAAACVTALIAVASPAQAATRGWQSVLTWRGGTTQACRVPRANDQVTVKVRANNVKGTYFALTAGMARIGGRHSYTRARRGKISNTIALTFKRGARVYLLIGSDVGITDDRTMKVSDLRRCA